jgi:hypothetical protein
VAFCWQKALKLGQLKRAPQAQAAWSYAPKGDIFIKRVKYQNSIGHLSFYIIVTVTSDRPAKLIKANIKTTDTTL